MIEQSPMRSVCLVVMIDPCFCFCVSDPTRLLAGNVCRRSTWMRTPPCGMDRAPEGLTSASSRRYVLLVVAVIVVVQFTHVCFDASLCTPVGYAIGVEA